MPLNISKATKPDLIFLDMGLPDISGLEVLRSLLDFTDAPVIVVSGNDTSESVAQALTISADDYITKPFVPIELMARVDSVVERTSFTAGEITLDFDRKQAAVSGNKVDLNLTEWDVLKGLPSKPGVVVDYSALKLQAWDSTDVSDAAVHMAIRRLRQKLKQVASEAEGDGLIRERRGIVYSISIE